MNNQQNQNMSATTEDKYWTDLRVALERLEQIPEFQKVIMEGFCTDTVLRNTSLLATDYVIKNGLRSNIFEKLVAVSHLENYFVVIKNLGADITKALGDEDEEDEYSRTTSSVM